MNCCEAALTRILATRLVGVLRLDDPRLAIEAGLAAVNAGLQVIEVAYTTTDAGSAIRELRRRCPDAMVGAGTVRSKAILDDALAAGAQFIVAPGLNRPTFEASAEAGVLCIPGMLTPSELEEALALGCRLLKLFPAEPLGPSYLAALRQPFPDAMLLPTGGIAPSNAPAYLQAGAVAVAMGSSLFPARRIALEGTAVVTPLVQEALAAVSNA
jgi:2-dehydro-3-deoxyphosphogluconate aldolase/(4S)-4-hydroxy-2-oxoglutarate aldolase